MDIDRPDSGWRPPPPRSPAAYGYRLELPPQAPAAPPLYRRARRRVRYLIAAVLCAVLAVSLGSAVVVQLRNDRAPQATVKHYFAALARGDAPAALALSATPSRGEYLTSTVLKQQLAIAKFADVVIGGTAVHGTKATTQVSYQLTFSSGTQKIVDAVDLIKQGSNWRLSRAATLINMTGSPSTAARLSFAGRPLPSERVLVFPGALPLATDNPAVQPVGQPLIRFIDDNQLDTLSVMLSAAASKTLSESLANAVTSCLTGASESLYCPVPNATRPIPGSLRGTRQVGPIDVAVSLSESGVIGLTATITVTGSWKTWDFNNQAIAHTGQTKVAVRAQASISDLNTIYWPSTS